MAWHSVDKPFAVGYPDGKILLATAESYETEQPLLLSAFPVSQHRLFHPCKCVVVYRPLFNQLGRVVTIVINVLQTLLPCPKVERGLMTLSFNFTLYGFRNMTRF